MKKTGYLIREFAKLTRVTVRTLRYYDQIGLLKPSFERPNGYRVYTDADLLKLLNMLCIVRYCTSSAFDDNGATSINQCLCPPHKL